MSRQMIQILLVLCGALTIVRAAPSEMQSAGGLAALVDSPTMRMVSDEDDRAVKQIKDHVADGFSDFKNINEVHAFLDKVKLLVQKHPKNLAFAQGELKELLQYLSTEQVTKLIRVDTDPFILPISDDRIPFAQRAVDEDELTRKLFGGPLRSFIESRRQPSRHDVERSSKDGNFFQNFWCKLTGCDN